MYLIFEILLVYALLVSVSETAEIKTNVSKVQFRSTLTRIILQSDLHPGHWVSSGVFYTF